MRLDPKTAYTMKADEQFLPRQSHICQQETATLVAIGPARFMRHAGRTGSPFSPSGSAT